MTIQQHNPSHPGELIKRTYIDLLDDISQEMAIRLSKVLGRSPESWLLMQDHHDLWKVRQTFNTDGLEPINFKVA